MSRKPEDAPFAYSGLERIFHERGRLSVCTCLIANPPGMTFTELQRACGLTDGNLNRHLHALAELAIVASRRESDEGRQRTTYRITDDGRERFLAYIDELETLVNDVHSRAARAPRGLATNA